MLKLTHLVRQIQKTKCLWLSTLAVSTLCAPSAHAQDIFESLNLNSFGDARLRYHTIDQDAFEQSAEALSLRVKLGIELNIFKNSTVLIEIEGSENFIENFNDTLNGQIGRPTISDPENFDINRLQFQTDLTPNTRLTLGRQKIALDDWRFIGHWDFRQNEQTFDAARLETKIGPGILDAAYIGHVERQFGNDSPFGEFDGDSFILNYGVITPVGRLVAFYYGLDLETGPEENRLSDLSSETFGARINGRHKWGDWGLNWDASIAQQREFADNPNDYSALYAASKLGVEYRNYDFSLKAEQLGSDSGQAVQTPLGTLHRLNGVADQFLMTPDEGLRDFSASAGYKLRNIGIFEDVRARASYHWFESDEGNNDFGEEIDFEISGKWKNIRFGVEYADYNANSFSSDAQVFILSTEFNFD